MSAQPHPGKVVFWDGNTHRIVRTADASELPERMLFADSPSGPVPIVKVVATTLGKQRHVMEYGPDDQLLRSTTQVEP